MSTVFDLDEDHVHLPVMCPKKMNTCLGITLLVVLCCTSWSSAGTTSRYMRRLEEGVDLPENSTYFKIPKGYNAPQQVHIHQGDFEGKAIIISWITPDEAGDSKVLYGKAPGSKYTTSVTGEASTYSFYTYKSGYIHKAVISGLEFRTRYYYTLGTGDAAREFTFVTPPESKLETPYAFGVIGDLGQTMDSVSTLQHYMKSFGQTVLYVGDLSYADAYPFDNNVRWDTWGRLVEPSTAYQPWIWTAGNHELDYLPEVGETIPFQPYIHRYHVPFEASGSTSPLWYSIKRGPATIIVLSSYSAYGKYTPQYQWFLQTLEAVDRSVTPWLIILVHSPWYNSNSYHYYEGETMRVIFEPFVVKYKVDIVFSGHVHAYERTYPVSNVEYNIVNGLCTPKNDNSAPVYVVIGDGGNVEGLSGTFTDPQPAYSAFREASFGHGLLEIQNHTHAYFTWHRNQDGERVSADSAMFLNKYWT
ncbi:hypothetical protein AXG93_3310s1210 [Marchantia polymorpha subsp. ruderalis]|uniref:Purple acid phosphatase n=1 Tax=Marchantia polymorpha subsp. ruderalis TaxID=1480154 RepID=A0A176W2M9_MARPO|nr:hypothetical protein AXG93_3310s1210 [Marchantia polymorpha subsp. ruderalis]